MINANTKPKNNISSSHKSNQNENSIGLESDSNEDNACVVCFKDVQIYSIGDCDHPVCYECSTRMRVLCQQNECPICRHVLSKVLFTYEKLPYRELESKNRSECYSKKYRIGFCSPAIQQKFFDLLDHPCPKCNIKPYRTFSGLRSHVRKEHDLYFCDLCIDNLKIFTFERRCYTQSELHLHRTKGDPDNRSHRGHPLCEYCNERYLDRDELFRHLRREHYFCHFCDADGCNEFYKDYAALSEHFRKDHFLCEEGKCATEQFIGAFRTEIDYRAHIASVHGKNMNKQQAKQTRTLQLEITLGPRGRNCQTEQGIADLRSRNEEMHYDCDIASGSSLYPQRPIDAGNEEEFPSLGGVSTGPNVSLVRPPPLSLRNLSATAGLARTKENFPALGSSGGFNSSQRADESRNSNYKTANFANYKSAIGRTNGNNSASNGMLIHVSNRPSSSQATNGNKKSNSLMDFPALPSGKGKRHNTRNLEEDMLPYNSKIPENTVSAKHRTLVDDYVSVANPSTFQRIQMVRKEEEEAKARIEASKKNAPKLTTHDFPVLSCATKSNTSMSSTWRNNAAEKKSREVKNRKDKVAPTPVLPPSKILNKSVNNTLNVRSNNQLEQATKKDKRTKEKKQNQENQTINTQKVPKSNETNQKKKNNNFDNNSDYKLPTKSFSNLSLTHDSTENLAACTPPGLLKVSDLCTPGTGVKPPPGFMDNVSVSSVAKLPNDLTFTSSLGESYSIVPSTHGFTQPPNAEARNQKLVESFREALKSTQALEEFRLVSQYFRNGICKPQAYYEHCRVALQNKFDTIFPELLALLPDITKQQELFLAHKQYLNSLSPTKRQSLPNLEVCKNCKQILIADDVENHERTHNFSLGFPELGTKIVNKF